MLFAAVFAVGDQFGIGLGHDELVLNGDRGDLDAQQFRSALCVVASGGHDVLGGDDDLFLGRDKVAATVHHLGAGDQPRAAVPLIAIDLPFTFDGHAALTGTLGHRHGDVGGVNVAVGRVIDRALQVVGLDQRPTLFDLLGRHPFIGHTTGFCG